MSITSTVVSDDASCTVIEDVDDTSKRLVATRVVWKSGSSEFNRDALNVLAKSAVADLNQAETLLNGGGGRWDALTPAQRTAIIAGLVRQNRALIRLVLGLLDSPS